MDKEILKIKQDMLQKIKDNITLVNSCKKHNFGNCEFEGSGFNDPAIKCLNCGGEVRLSKIFSYIEGYVAAGGNGRDIANHKFFERAYRVK